MIAGFSGKLRRRCWFRSLFNFCLFGSLNQFYSFGKIWPLDAMQAQCILPYVSLFVCLSVCLSVRVWYCFCIGKHII